VPGEVEAGCPAAGLTRKTLGESMDDLLESDELRVPGMALLARAGRCSADDVAAIQTYQQYVEATSYPPSPRQSQVLYWNVVFSDLWENPAPSMDELTSRCDALAICGGGSVSLGEVQTMWPSFPPDPLSTQSPVVTSSAVLLMNGTLDPQTPLANAVAFDGRLQSPHKTFVQMPFSAHATISQALVTNPAQPPCGYQILTSFLGNPGAPDTSCAGAARPVSFASDPTVSESLFGTPDYWGDAPADASASDATTADAGDAGWIASPL
jgi:hypothetical protein